MEEYRPKFRLSSSESSDLIDGMSIEDGGEDEQFYEKIEAPKFVDFTVPDHYVPDDRHWFCLRFGCDQKHEEEMDSEEIYKNFALRVMAARSPNVKLRKTINRNCSRTPIKCPRSAPPKSSKSRLSSRLAVISSISQKMIKGKTKVVRPLLKPESTPKNKTKPVASKYLTTPRNKKCLPNPNSFHSVQHSKPTTTEVAKNRLVAKTLVFHSPKRAVKIKTSMELRTPITKLCEGMKKLEITSQKKPFLGYSTKSSKNPDCRGLLNWGKVRTAREKLNSQARIRQESKSVRSSKSKIKGKLIQRVSKKMVGEDLGELDISKSSGGKLDVASSPDACRRKANCLAIAEKKSLEGNTISISEKPNRQENDISNTNELRDKPILGTEHAQSSGGILVDVEPSSSKGATHENGVVESDDKENVMAFDEKRGDTAGQKRNGTKIHGVLDTSGKPKKGNTERDNVAPVLKFKKQKPTTPKPFRLRTDERMTHKDANLERKINFQSHQNENAVLTLPNDIQKDKKIIAAQKPLQVQETAEAAATATPQRSHGSRHQERMPITSAMQSNAIKRLEKFRKMKSPLKKQSVRPKGPDSTRKEAPSNLIPGQKVDVIHETSAGVSENKKRGKLACNVRRPVTTGKEPTFHSTHIPRSCSRFNPM